MMRQRSPSPRRQFHGDGRVVVAHHAGKAGREAWPGGNHPQANHDDRRSSDSLSHVPNPFLRWAPHLLPVAVPAYILVLPPRPTTRKLAKVKVEEHPPPSRPVSTDHFLSLEAKARYHEKNLSRDIQNL